MTKKDPGMNPADELELSDQVQIWEEGLGLHAGGRPVRKRNPAFDHGAPSPSSPSFIWSTRCQARGVQTLIVFWKDSHAAGIEIKFLAASNDCRVPEPVQTKQRYNPRVPSFYA
jgi:hypothetical protein